MRKRIVALMLTLAMLASIAATPQVSGAAPHTPGEVPDTLPPFESQYFPETQHAAMNSFLAFWKRTPNALFVLGYPISQPFIEESFTNPGEYYRVQYFERAILEEHPENSGTQFYILGRLLGNQITASRTGEAAFQLKSVEEIQTQLRFHGYQGGIEITFGVKQNQGATMRYRFPGMPRGTIRFIFPDHTGYATLWQIIEDMLSKHFFLNRGASQMLYGTSFVHNFP